MRIENNRFSFRIIFLKIVSMYDPPTQLRAKLKSQISPDSKLLKPAVILVIQPPCPISTPLSTTPPPHTSLLKCSLLKCSSLSHSPSYPAYMPCLKTLSKICPVKGLPLPSFHTLSMPSKNLRIRNLIFFKLAKKYICIFIWYLLEDRLSFSYII